MNFRWGKGHQRSVHTDIKGGGFLLNQPSRILTKTGLNGPRTAFRVGALRASRNLGRVWSRRAPSVSPSLFFHSFYDSGLSANFIFHPTSKVYLQFDHLSSPLSLLWFKSPLYVADFCKSLLLLPLLSFLRFSSAARATQLKPCFSSVIRTFQWPSPVSVQKLRSSLWATQPSVIWPPSPPTAFSVFHGPLAGISTHCLYCHYYLSLPTGM